MIHSLPLAKLPTSPPASVSRVLPYSRFENGLSVRIGNQIKRLTFFAPDIVRVTTNLGQDYATSPSFTIVMKPGKTDFHIKATSKGWTVRTRALRLDIEARTGAITYYRADGQRITQESASSPTSVKQVTLAGAPTYDVRQTFKLDPKESLYGLGQYNRSYMDYRGQDVLLVQTNIGIVVPMLVSTRRYGILWDIASKGTFHDDANGATFWGESAPSGADYYFIAGTDMDGVLRGYRQLTGSAPMYPKAAFGLFMSKERYQTQQQLANVVRSFRKDKFPLDYIVQDWQYWGGADGSWSGMTWDKTRYPDPVGLTKTLHNELHVKLMNSIWPSVGNDTGLAHELDQYGLRFEPLHWISKQARIYDAFSPLGRQIYFKWIKKGLLDKGVDALWMDGTEVEVGGACHDPNEVEADIKRLGKNAAGDFFRNLNNYSLLTTKGTYEGQRATSDKRVLTLTRSAWIGQQRYAALPWSGDTTASWQTLHAQIAGGLNVAMAGLPYWTQDTGGFFIPYSQGMADPTYRELFNRWLQFAVFNPVFRIHGTNIDREPYRYRDLYPEFYASLRQSASLRYQLLPYIYSLAWQTTHNGYTMMRGLAMDFPDDAAVRKVDDAYMFGPSLLIHPITRPMYSVVNPPANVVPSSVLRTADGRPGLDVQYYAGTHFDTPAGKTVDLTVDHTWPGPPLANPPAGLTGFDNFSARWTGTLTAPEDGEYEIGAEGDDGFRVFVDGRMIAEDWTEAAKRYRGARVNLRRGQVVSIKLEYFQGYRDRAMRFVWRTPTELRKLKAAANKIDNRLATYLPARADWYDFATGEKLPGGRTHVGVVPFNRIPVYVRAGSIVPMGPDLQYATERPNAPLTLRIYPGRDADFTLYEDDNETYRYEKGERAEIPIHWNDRARTLTVGARQGRFPGMVTNREFHVTVVGSPSPLKVVPYVGRRVRIAVAR